MQPKAARNREEAETALRAYCTKIDFDPEWLGDRWETTLRIACDPQFGLGEALKTIEEDKLEVNRSARRAQRQAQVAADPLPGRVATDGRFGAEVREVMTQLCAAYVGGYRVNLELGGDPMDPTAYEPLRQEWKEVRNAAATYPGCIFTAFVAHVPQDKRAVGRGNVGDTLGKRRFQGDLLVTIDGVKFNMHVNTTGL
jgi:hypothetical protein